MWKKSAAMMPSDCVVRNWRQVGPERRGAGSMPAALRISARGVVPLCGDEPAVPGKQGAEGDREDLFPVVPGYQPGQGGEPEPVGRLIADRSGQLATQDRVLVPQHQQFRLLRRPATQEPRWNSEQLLGHLVQQGHDHGGHDPSGLTAPGSPAAMTFRAAQGVGALPSACFEQPPSTNLSSITVSSRSAALPLASRARNSHNTEEPNPASSNSSPGAYFQSMRVRTASAACRRRGSRRSAAPTPGPTAPVTDPGGRRLGTARRIPRPRAARPTGLGPASPVCPSDTRPAPSALSSRGSADSSLAATTSQSTPWNCLPATVLAHHQLPHDPASPPESGGLVSGRDDPLLLARRTPGPRTTPMANLAFPCRMTDISPNGDRGSISFQVNIGRSGN
ncbi:hypothetical protein GA0115260_1045718 [Streptomyces sp. MnatMP-M27]|nr:hypothetical protein GA0115260_1045718 [Streptomyces sp. MnatMP-M27]